MAIQIEYKVKATGNKIRYERVPCDAIFNVPIYDKDDTLLGRALLTQHMDSGGNGKDIVEKVILLDIIVYDPENRGKGIGDELMGFLTLSGMFQQIVTGLSTKEGRALCVKWGFKFETIKHHKVLIFRKGKENESVKEGDVKENGQQERK